MSDTSKCVDCGRPIIVTWREDTYLVTVCRPCDVSTSQDPRKLSVDDPVHDVPVTELFDTESWIDDVRSAFGRAFEDDGLHADTVLRDGGGTWFVETGVARARAGGPWHRTFQVMGSPGQPITFVEI